MDDYDDIIPSAKPAVIKETSTVIIPDSNDYETEGLNGDIVALGITTSTGIDSSPLPVKDDYEHVVVKPEGKTIIKRTRIPDPPPLRLIEEEEIITKKNGVYGDTTFKTDTKFFDPFSGEQIHLSEVETHPFDKMSLGALPHSGITTNPVGVYKSSEYIKKWAPGGQSEQGDYLPTLSESGRNLRTDYGGILYPTTAGAWYETVDEFGMGDYTKVPGSWRPPRTTGIAASKAKADRIAELEASPGYSAYHDKVYETTTRRRERKEGDYISGDFENWWTLPKEGRGASIDGWIGTVGPEWDYEGDWVQDKLIPSKPSDNLFDFI